MLNVDVVVQEEFENEERRYFDFVDVRKSAMDEILQGNGDEDERIKRGNI